MWYALGQPTDEQINVSHIPALHQLSGALTNAQLVNSSVTVAGVSVPLGGAVTTAQIASALTGSGYKLTDNDTTYTLTKSGSTITLTGSNGSKTSVTDSNTTYTLGSFGITATAAEINRLDGITASTAELNFVDGVTSNIQTQLNAKANASALTAYALKDGSNASGAWGISISGTATYASVLSSNSSTSVSNYLKYRMIIGQTSLVGSNAVNGAWCLPTTGGDAKYGNGQILRFGWAQNYYTDLHTGPNEIGSSSGLQFRQVIAGTVSSLGWRTLLDTSNYASTLDSRYLLKSSYTASDILAKLKTVDGSGSGLDADLLDGYNIASVRLGVSDLGAQINAAGWYRVYTSATSNAQQHNNIILHLERGYISPQNEHYTFSISVGFNGDINITQLSGVIGGHLITKIRVVWANSQKYYIDIYTDYRNHANWYSVYGQGYGTFSGFTAGATIPSGYNSYEFTTSEGCKSDRGFIGSLSGNATSATKLATARSIWGQTFDGTNNVSGDMTGVGMINGGLNISIFGSNSDNSDTTRFLTYGHRVEFGGPGYAHQSYYFRPQYSANGATYADVYIQNASAAASPVFSTTHYFDHNGNAYHWGNLGLGVVPSGYKLAVAGTIHSTTGIFSDGYVSAKGQDTTSDARYKRDVAALPAQAALAVLMRLRPSTWAWKDDGRRGAGFVAQEVTGVLPEAVREVGNGEDRHLALNYQMLHAYEVCLLQTHETELERLRGRVNQLENEIKRIRHGS